MAAPTRGTVEIKGEQRPILHIFSAEYSFSIPPYQRPYAWEKEHAEALLDDLLVAMGDPAGDVAAGAGSLSPYFLGTLVLVECPNATWDVVDGQQRLITLTILLAALRALLPPEYANPITPLLYDPANKLIGQPHRFRVRPRPQDAAFFERHIQHEGGIEGLRQVAAAGLMDSQANMRTNALLYLERLSPLPVERRIRLAQYIVLRCLLIVVSTHDLDSAYRIFTVLNDRGLDLSHADILKAQIIGGIPQEYQHEYTTRWESTEDNLGRDDFESLLSHIRMLYRKQKQQDTILKEFRDHVVSAFRDYRQLVDTVILPLGAAYATIKDEDYESTHGAEVINTNLRWLNRIPDSNWLPPAILYLARHRHDPDECGRFFTELERLAAGLMLRRANVNKRIERYGNVLAAIESGADLYAPTSPLQLTDDERRDILRTLEGNLLLENARTRLYVLLRLDTLLSRGDAVYQFPIITAEHVLPQQPRHDSDWVTWFPTQQERDRWVHRLGNLALLSRRKNTAAGNLDFDKNKTAYFARDGVSPFALTTQVLRYRAWTPEVVAQRQAELVGHLKQLWRL